MKVVSLRFAVAVIAAFVASSAFRAFGAEMEYATPESQGVKSSSIVRYLEECDAAFNAEGLAGSMHGFAVVRHGKIIAEGSWKPFDTLNNTHMLYSHSKSFTSTAVGILVSDGKLNINERIVDIFPEETKGTTDENLKSLRVVDLLTMNIGAPRDHSIGRDSSDWVRKFFMKKFEKQPGTCFRYDSDATFLVSAIVQKRTGRNLMEFLKERLFDKIGIEKAWSTYAPGGIACGGWGMNMTTREMARFGQLLLQEGFWNGEPVVPSWWVRLATSWHTPSGWKNVAVRSLGDGSDWEQGYGFQFWRCRHGAYRADGAAGQLTVIFPKEDMVVSVHAGLKNPTLELELIYRHLISGLSDASLPENPKALAELKAKCAGLEIAPLKGSQEQVDRFLDINFQIATNRCNLASAKLYRKDGMLRLAFRTKDFSNDFEVGCGEWKAGSVKIHAGDIEWLGAIIGEQAVVASGAFEADKNRYRVRVYLTGTTTYVDFNFSFKDGVPVLDGRFWSLAGCVFRGERAR